MNIDSKDFLEDNMFLLWQLTGDNELGEYWETFLNENPSLRNDFDKAIEQFPKLRFGNGTLTPQELEWLRRRIHSEAKRHGRRRKIYDITYYVSAACIACLICFSLHYFHSHYDILESGKFIAKNIIVGENLDNENISLMTGSVTNSFANNVEVHLDKNGKATIKEGKGTTVVNAGKDVMNKLIVPHGKRSQLILPDGTKVWINSGSVLEFPSSFAGESRNINLAGEIYIEVAPNQNKPFYVNTPKFRVQVYGTTFNISAYLGFDEQSIVLVEGSISVTTPSNEKTFLRPNDMLSCKNDMWDKKAVDVTKYISWKDGYMLLDHTPIEVVLKKMELYYNLSFNLHNDVNIASKACTGKLYLSENLDEVMAAISLLSSTKYTREDKTIYIQY